MLGVLPEYRCKGVGLQLKVEQKKYTLMQGIKLITSYIDPLESIISYISIGNLVELHVIIIGISSVQVLAISMLA